MLTDVFYMKERRVWMTLPPGHGKSTLITYFIPWALAHYPDCKFIYISYSSELAAGHTANIKSIIEMPMYRHLFGVEISRDSSAKADFRTNYGGAVKAFGSQGAITGQDAGLPNLQRFSGGVLMDDMHKPDEVFSDTMRQSVIDNFNNTIKTRPRSPNVPIIGIGHALHEDDLQAFLLAGKDGAKWNHLLLQAEDVHGNILAPNLITREMLDAEKKFNEYVYWAQYQGTPQPAGGGIFKTDHFELLDKYPEMLCTFITVDTAESVSNYADYTVFSFWGFYEIKYKERVTGEYGLHWIDCKMERIVPADLESELMDFYRACLDFPKPPNFIAIEKKSTGTTLISTLEHIRGLDIRDITRTKVSKSKTARYFEAQPYVAKRLVSLPRYSNHTAMVIDHMRKITANNTHRHDDIADTLYDAIKIAFIDKTLIRQVGSESKNKEVAKALNTNFNNISKLRANVCQR
jgi:predicted phage terminase large subunit-like protein